MNYLEITDWLAIAHAVLGLDIKTLTNVARLDLADSALHAPAAGFGEIEFHETFAEKAAVLLERLTNCHALPDGNKRTALLSTIEFANRNGYDWEPPAADDDHMGEETARVMLAIASEDDLSWLLTWVEDRVEDRLEAS